MQCQAIVFAVLALCLHQGYALTCYSCSSDKDPKCGDPFDSNLSTTECQLDIINLLVDNAIVCQKLVNRVNGTMVIERSCSAAFECSLSKYDYTTTFCENCHADGCNTATGIIPSTLLMMSAATALILFKQ